MAGADKRVVGAVVLASAAGAFALAMFSFVFPEISRDFDLTVDQVNLALRLPIVASLIVVFLAGSLSDRLGRRRVAVGGGLCFCAGSVVVAVAPGIEILMAGRLLEGLGASTLVIGAVAVTRSAFSDAKARSVVYGILTATVPAVFVVAPTVGALIATSASWRLVPVLLLVVGAVATLAVWRFFPDNEQQENEKPELLTPALAGVVLTALAGAAVAFSTSGRVALILLGVALVAGIPLATAMRAQAAPALDLSPLRSPGFSLALLAASIPVAVNFFFFTSLLVEYHYDYGIVSAASILAPASLLSAVAGYAGGRVMARRGATFTGVLGLSIAAAAGAAVWLVGEGGTIVGPLLIVCAYTCGDTMAITALTANVLNRVPGEKAGAGASLRKAATGIGATVGAVAVTFVVFGAYERELSRSINTTVVSEQDAKRVAAEVRNGEGSELLAEGLAVKYPEFRSELYKREPALEEAEIKSYRAAGTAALLAYATTAGLLLYSRRRESGDRKTGGSAGATAR